jgi:hypothetical protein
MHGRCCSYIGEIVIALISYNSNVLVRKPYSKEPGLNLLGNNHATHAPVP